MHMVGLHREMHDAKPAARRVPERPSNSLDQDLLSPAWQASQRAHRDVDRMRLLVPGPSAMRNASSRLARLASRSTAPTSTGSKLELLLMPSLHVIGLF